MILTYRYRIKDASTARYLERHARAVNFVWNYCVDVQRQAMRWRRKWPHWTTLDTLCRGASVELGLHSDTVTAICRRFAWARDQHRRCPRFRASRGPKRALGWMPIRGRSLRIDGDMVTLLKRHYRLWLSRPIDGALQNGSFSQDARGRWYLNIGIDVPEVATTATGEIGIDLGLKTLATCSDGATVPALQHSRQHAVALAKAQRSGNRARARAISAKVANCRRDQHHKASTRIVHSNRRIVVGNVSASTLAKTKMAKSVFDVGWYSFKAMLRYKAIRHGVEFVEVNEAFTTRTCSNCGSIGGPQGIAGLGIRRWTCSDCGADHDRDLNSARNILRVGAECRPPAEEIAA